MHPSASLLVLSSFDDTAVRRACLHGDLVRVCSGRYVRSTHWAAFDARERHVMLVLAAVSLLSNDVVVSHASAAALWGLPRLGPWPEKVHVVDSSLATTTVKSTVVKHSGTLAAGDVDVLFGLPVTSASRTAVDMALTAPFRQSVVVLDAGLRARLFTRDDLLRHLSTRSRARGSATAARAIDFADARADRPLESLSRVIFDEGSLDEPEVQRQFTGPHGEKWFVDFFFRGSGVVGEADGLVKYGDAQMRHGLSPAEIVIAEKVREDAIRRDPDVRAFVRWTWSEALTPGLLVDRLVAAGVPRRKFRRPRAEPASTDAIRPGISGRDT